MLNLCANGSQKTRFYGFTRGCRWWLPGFLLSLWGIYDVTLPIHPFGKKTHRCSLEIVSLLFVIVFLSMAEMSRHTHKVKLLPLQFSTQLNFIVTEEETAPSCHAQLQASHETTNSTNVEVFVRRTLNKSVHVSNVQQVRRQCSHQGRHVISFPTIKVNILASWPARVEL